MHVCVCVCVCVCVFVHVSGWVSNRHLCIDGASGADLGGGGSGGSGEPPPFSRNFKFLQYTVCNHFTTKSIIYINSPYLENAVKHMPFPHYRARIMIE